jgi:hypothetical protein
LAQTYAFDPVYCFGDIFGSGWFDTMNSAEVVRSGKIYISFARL